MRRINFAKRNFKEIIRDPVSIIFAIVLPLFLLFIFQQFNIPSDIYKIENFTPGIIVFSFSFISLFTATLVSSDRNTSFLIRLGVSPMKSYEYIFGYVLSVLPIVLIQNIMFFSLALLLGLNFSIHIIFTILISIPLSVLFIMLGILIGSITSEKASSGVGSIIVQLVAFTSGMYFSTDLTGKVFNIICNSLPFKYTLNIIKDTLNAVSLNLKDILVFTLYLLVVSIISVIIFKKKMISDNK